VYGWVCKAIRRVWDWIYCTYTFTTRDTMQYNDIADLHTCQFTVTHALGFSVFTSRILPTDLSLSHCNFKAHMKFSLHSLIYFLPLFSTQFISSAPTLISRQVGVAKLVSSLLDYCSLSQSQSHIVTDGQSISKSWCPASSGAHDQIFITLWQLGSCFCRAPSLTRGRVLLALTSAVFLGSVSLGIRDHILLSQIWHSLFVASYYSQDHGGGIRPRLHTGVLFSSQNQDQTQSYITTDGYDGHLGLTTRSLLLLDSCKLVDVGRSLWRGDGSVVCQT
jgi:hypothetical protein